ncbi:guanylate kinase [Roseomonas sp. NAR14]|uniref:Guanylate kinase n=1 Tax=Roseomonas acroporae TaxID=2937791 RepID=A0A9X1YAF8_9PROT|nr:guanylate kinase [Roseomonas acroporae]MCK8782836.1 guanylate kinase [Roseomonas acroporae]
MNRRGLCLVLAAPSGAGKSSVGRALLATDPSIALSVSATTRAPRPGEVDGVHYHFRSHAEFEAMIGRDELLEHAHVFGRRYGTPRAPVLAALEAGRDVLFDIDWQGHRQLRASLGDDVVGIFLLPPSVGELRRRLEARQQDVPAEIERRMQAARDEIVHWDEFGHVLVNRDFDSTVVAVRTILAAARLARARQPWLPGFVGALMRE